MKTSITWSPGAGLNVVGVERRERAWTVTVGSRQPTFCPGCGAQSKSRHSTYWRTLRDLSAQGAPVVVNARLGRWRCRNQLCDRRIFTERVPSLAAPFARRTARLAGALSHQPFLLISTYRFAGAGFNKVNWLGVRSRTASAPILARCDNALVRHGRRGASASCICLKATAASAMAAWCSCQLSGERSRSTPLR
jgi:hypothetical protein